MALTVRCFRIVYRGFNSADAHAWVYPARTLEPGGRRNIHPYKNPKQMRPLRFPVMVRGLESRPSPRSDLFLIVACHGQPPSKKLRWTV